MRAILNGAPGVPINWAKGSNNSVKALLMNDDSSVLNLTGGAVNLLVYDRSDRANAPLATHVNETLTTPTAGLATVAIDDSELTYGPGEYYLFVRYVATGGEVYFAEPYVLTIR
jgi:hypothetical protein